MRGFSASVFGNTYLKEGLLIVAALTLLVIIQSMLMPRVKDVRYRYANESYTTDSLPLAINKQVNHASLEAWATLELFPFQGTEFRISGDDCLAILDINGTRVVDNPSCTFSPQPHYLELGAYLHTGKNDVHIVVNDTRGVKIGFAFDPTESNLLMTTLRFLLLLLPIFWLATIVHRTIGRTMLDIEIMIYAAFLLRMLYVVITPYGLRNYDVEGHIQYIEFVMRHWTVPIASHGWGFHQGPLYYFLTAPFLGVATFLGHSKTVGLGWIQNASLMMSCLSVLAATWCGTALFDYAKERRSLLLFIGLLFFLPSTLMFASRINNDVLFQLIALCFAGSLLRWWKNGERRWLLITSVIIGVGFLTKANAYLFAPIFFICIAVRPQLSPEKKFRELVIAGGIIVLIAGWLLVLRYLHNDFSRLFLSGDGMNPALKTGKSWSDLVTFSPLSIVKTPFIFITPLPERGYFLTYFFRSALFGEFVFRSASTLFMARLLSVLGMGSVLITAAGMLKRIRMRDDILIPLLIIILIVLEGAVSYRILHPSMPNQDFRFSILLLPAVFYFTISATRGPGIMSRIARAWLLAFIICAIGFFAALIAHSL